MSSRAKERFLLEDKKQVAESFIKRGYKTLKRLGYAEDTILKIMRVVEDE